jgi:organic radical activating enzyme
MTPEIAINNESLILSDDKVFYTIEGEGKLVGKPSVFMRLAMCNLTCSAWKSPDSPYGCDSYISWSKKNKMTFQEIWDKFFSPDGECKYAEHLIKGAVLKITGGEPLIQHKQLNKFIWWLNDKIINAFPQLADEFHLCPYDLQYCIDIETNATIMPPGDWYLSGITYTTSPKLSTNGDPISKTYKSEVLQYHSDIDSCFKFVITNQADVDEVFEKFINPFRIKLHNVWFMPCCGSRKEHTEQAEMVAEFAKQIHVNFSPRLQLIIWDKALKV